MFSARTAVEGQEQQQQQQQQLVASSSRQSLANLLSTNSTVRRTARPDFNQAPKVSGRRGKLELCSNHQFRISRCCFFCLSNFKIPPPPPLSHSEPSREAERTFPLLKIFLWALPGRRIRGSDRAKTFDDGRQIWRTFFARGQISERISRAIGRNAWEI